MRKLSYSDVRNRLASVLDSVIDSNEPVVVTRRGDTSDERAVVMMPLAFWSGMVETMYLLRGRNGRRLVRSLAEHRAGLAKSHQLVEGGDA